MKTKLGLVLGVFFAFGAGIGIAVPPPSCTDQCEAAFAACTTNSQFTFRQCMTQYTRCYQSCGVPVP